jgi:maltooligosyltrehalose trehalohydrolase
MRRSDWRMDMGATVLGDGVRFRVWAPAARRVDVQLAAECTPLAQTDDGVWEGVVAQARAGSTYRYCLDGAGAYPDPYSRSQPDGPHGPSEVVDPGAYEWHDQAWPGISMDGLVIYQLHFGTFTPQGTFESAIEQLPRLKALGVTALEPLPVAEFPGTRNWGYDGVDLFAPSHIYGGPHGLKRFVDAAHEHGLGVLLDGVYNHFGPDGNYLRAFAKDYFTDRHETPWGEAINYANPWMRRLVIDNARYWVAEYHVDGLRLDATHAIIDDSPTHILAELSQAVDGILIAESNENDVRFLRPVEEGGLGMDAVYADDFHHALRRYLAGDHEGYYARFAGTLEEVARCIESGWLRGKPALKQPARQFVFTIQNHDQIGNRPFGDRLHHGIDGGRYAAASMLLLFLPQTPFLFMGQEFCASSPFQYFTDHNPELGRLVTEGRRREFRAFSGFKGVPDPQAESTFFASKLKLEEAEGSPVQELYRAMLRLRHSDAVLVDQSRERTSAEVVSKDVLRVRRWRVRSERLLVANFGETAHSVSYGWRLLFSSDPANSDQLVQPHSAGVFTRES